MQPISKQPSHPEISVGEPFEEHGRKKIILSWKDLEHEITVPIPDGKDQPSSRKVMLAITRGIDDFHHKIREERHPDGRDDEIREV